MTFHTFKHYEISNKNNSLVVIAVTVKKLLFVIFKL